MHQDGKREEISGGGLSRVEEELRAILGPSETLTADQPIIILKDYEMFAAAWNGCRRRLHVIRDLELKKSNAAWPGGGNGFEPGYFDESIEGSAGEVAVAKYLNCYWDYSVNTWQDPDLAGFIQVRTRSKFWHDLNVRWKDAEHEVFVLVTGRMPTYCLRGWAYGHEAKRDEYLKNPGGFHPAFFMPQKDLRPMATLKEMIR